MRREPDRPEVRATRRPPLLRVLLRVRVRQRLREMQQDHRDRLQGNGPFDPPPVSGESNPMLRSQDLSYKDKHWHEACFLCTTCGESLVDKQFGSKGDRIYCGRCYDEQFASRCDGCHEIFRAGRWTCCLICDVHGKYLPRNFGRPPRVENVVVS